MKPKLKSPHTSDIPDSLVEILCARARYEEAKKDEIELALAAGDKDLIFKLAAQMIFEGPGTIPRTKPKQAIPKGKTRPRGRDKK